MSADHCLVLIAAPDADLAARLSDALVAARLAACVQTMPIESTYRWAGELQRDAEVLLLAKSRTALLDDLIAEVKARHSYQVPEIIALPIIGGGADYLTWLDAETDR